ncbi:ATP-dependent helicase HrpB [uncultured Cellulomonas sp.]|uniref:ATP-dependent helicase HrpB n=1 Tax=uncultured Cellulomonas sp. TaxID=189682 RepID=UPI002606EC62|nr:ATP-dependent helicase HrpB [uncultured Cellulomonas sp.]
MTDDALRRLLREPPDLPVGAALPRLVGAVAERGTAVLLAPPGAGKTTLVPPALAAEIDGRVVVTQPRRLAVRAAARRLAALLGEPVGATVGYAVRGDHRSGPGTRVEVVTTGLLLRRLQADPELPGVGAVVLDEVHERHLDADLCLALMVDVRSHLRELPVVAMSATLDADQTAAVLGGGAPSPVVEAPASLHPVERVWAPPPRGVLAQDDRGVTPAFLDHVAACTRRALRERAGDVLVFVPGAGEVAGVVRRLGGAGADVRPLHGRLSPDEQDLALTAGPRRRVVVATAVAESSLTVPGVRVVVDAGLAREPRTDHRRGLAGLVTVRVSRSGATQRAGRAGRQGPGAVYRCWSPADHARLEPQPRPEIATADLTAFALELACWGSPDGADLALLDRPPAAALTLARGTLAALGAVDAHGAVTARGRVIAGLGTDPRLARALLDAAPLVGARRAAEVVALLGEDVRAPGGDLTASLRDLRRGGPGAAAWAQATRRLLAALPRGDGGASPGRQVLDDDHAVGLVVALAHPDRVARLRAGGATYLMASGTGAVLPPGASALAGAPWLAVADADRSAGRRDATVRSAAPLDEDLARRAAPALLAEQDVVEWVDGRVVARRTTTLGAIELAGATLTRPDPALVAEAVRAGLERDGVAVLPWSPAATALRRRLAFLHTALGEPWPDVSDDALASDLAAWLGPELSRVRRADDLRRLDLVAALRRLLPWPAAARLDELAPERVTVPSGSSVRVDYGPDQPVLAVRLQETFGWRRTPRLAAGRVPLLLHLLSPAGRPAAVTADLESFWRTGYPQVRAELRGRYPKHAWPEDPATEPPTRGVRRPPGGTRR